MLGNLLGNQLRNPLGNLLGNPFPNPLGNPLGNWMGNPFGNSISASTNWGSSSATSRSTSMAFSDTRQSNLVVEALQVNPWLELEAAENKIPLSECTSHTEIHRAYSTQGGATEIREDGCETSGVEYTGLYPD